MNFWNWMIGSLIAGAILALIAWFYEKLKALPHPEEGMWCPKCGSQYRPGFKKCADCEIPLVHERPVNEEAGVNDLEAVFTSHDMNQVTFVKSLLGGHGIRFVVQGDQHLTRNNIFGVLPIPVRFLVPSDQVAQAKSLLKGI